MKHALAVRPESDPATALAAAADVVRIANDKGLPAPLRIGATTDGVDVSLFMPDLLRWIEMLDRAKIGTDPAGYLVIYGEAGGQEWALHPVREDCPEVDEHGTPRVCRACEALPDIFRQPISPEAWRDQRWFELTGSRWPAFDRAVLVPIG